MSSAALRGVHVGAPRTAGCVQRVLHHAPWSLALVHVRHLEVQGNTITGTIPTWLSVLTQLEYVCVSRQWLGVVSRVDSCCRPAHGQGCHVWAGAV